MKISTLFKPFVLVLCLLMLSVVADAQVNTVSTFTGKTYAKATTSTDTSAIISIGSYPFVSVSTISTGSDSSAINVIVDGLINGTWSNLLTSQALQLGRPAGHTLSTTKGQVSSFILRSNGFMADLAQNCSQIRIRNTHSAFANGSTDSTSALTYTQKVVLRH